MATIKLENLEAVETKSRKHAVALADNQWWELKKKSLQIRDKEGVVKYFQLNKIKFAYTKDGVCVLAPDFEA
jgi:hypothetical protein